MKKLTASEARDLVELAGISEIYEEISRRAQAGLFTAEFSEITEKEFNQLIKDGFDIFVDYGTGQLTRYNQDIIEQTDYVIIDWEK